MNEDYVVLNDDYHVMTVSYAKFSAWLPFDDSFGNTFEPGAVITVQDMSSRQPRQTATALIVSAEYAHNVTRDVLYKMIVKGEISTMALSIYATRKLKDV